ncbi:hypothetical protein CGRA01v4_01870 [Colletotrichum graminicola]|nr:hypothetical protein CGRA01v4_01870 [Colletotrichum graminicola]
MVSTPPLPVGRGRVCTFFKKKKTTRNRPKSYPVRPIISHNGLVQQSSHSRRARFREGRRKPHSPASAGVGGAKAVGEMMRAFVEVFPVALGISHPRQPTHLTLLSACRRRRRRRMFLLPKAA